MTRSKTGWLFLGSAFVLALAGVTPVAYAHGGDSTLIHACVNKSSGEVKIVGANGSCKNNETALDWPGTLSAGGGGGLVIAGGSVFSGQLRYSLTPVGVDDQEVSARWPVPRAGQLKSLAVNPVFNSLTAAAVITVRVNGTDTALQVNVPAGSTQVEIVLSDVAVVAGDLVTLEIDATQAGAGAITVRAAYEYQPS